MLVAANPVSLAPDDEFADLLDDFLASQLSPLTRSSYAGDLTIFLSWLAGRDKHPRDVSRPDIDRYRNWLAELIGPDGKPAGNGRPRYAPATIARKLSAVRAFYNYLSERRVIPGSPAAGVKGPKLRREPRGRAITDDQVRRLLAVATERGHETEAMICLLLLNGLRVSELCSADIENLHREPGGGHSLVVRGKGGKDVDVALNDRTERAVLKTVGARSQGPIFRRQDGRRLRAGAAAPASPTTARRSTACSASSPSRPGWSARATTRSTASTRIACATPSSRSCSTAACRSPRSRTRPATPPATRPACTTAPAPPGASTRPTSSTSDWASGCTDFATVLRRSCSRLPWRDRAARSTATSLCLEARYGSDHRPPECRVERHPPEHRVRQHHDRQGRVLRSRCLTSHRHTRSSPVRCRAADSGASERP